MSFTYDIKTVHRPRLCGAPATTSRIVEDLVCPLCERHANQIDRETP